MRRNIKGSIILLICVGFLSGCAANDKANGDMAYGAYSETAFAANGETAGTAGAHEGTAFDENDDANGITDAQIAAAKAFAATMDRVPQCDIPEEYDRRRTSDDSSLFAHYNGPILLPSITMN